MRDEWHDAIGPRHRRARYCADVGIAVIRISGGRPDWQVLLRDSGPQHVQIAGVIKESWPTVSGGGIDDKFSLPLVERERYNLTDFWIDVQVSGEGLTIGGTVAPR